jgi:2-isopropylmalate synthase
MINWNQIIDKLDYAFQPIIHSHTGKIYAVEALIRNVQNVDGLNCIDDLVNFAFNLYSQGINPNLDLKYIDKIKEMYEKLTNLKIHPRHPFVGDMIFTAFSGGHQDAIKKGMDFYRNNQCEKWNVPYLPIDPKDINRSYEQVIRVNSQSGKGGVSFIISEFFGVKMSKEEEIAFGKIIKKASDEKKKELTQNEIIELYKNYTFK